MGIRWARVCDREVGDNREVWGARKRERNKVWREGGKGVEWG